MYHFGSVAAVLAATFFFAIIKVVPETVGVFTGFRTCEGLPPIFDGDVIFDRVNNVYNVECRVGGVYVVSGGISMLLSSCADANATVDLTLVETHFL